MWERANRLLPKTSIETYTQALMDLGATVCTRTAPRCDACPVRTGCKARKANQTAQIPAPRPRKPLPQKAVTWLLLLDRGQILLEKRPAPGIWGDYPAIEAWLAKIGDRPAVKRGVGVP